MIGEFLCYVFQNNGTFSYSGLRLNVFTLTLDYSFIYIILYDPKKILRVFGLIIKV